MQSMPLIQPHALLGLRIGVKGSAAYISDNEVVYPSASVLTLHNFTQSRQRFIRLREKDTANILCLHPSKTSLALAEVGAKPTISGYEIASRRRKKVMSVSFETTAKEYVSLAFTYDGKYLLAILGSPDWLLVCFNWEKSRVESYTKANYPNNPEVAITQVTCSPTDNSVVCLVGPGLFRLMAVTDGVWRQFGWQEADKFLVSCSCWIRFDRILVGTSDDILLLVEAGDLKSVFKASEIAVINMKKKDGEKIDSAGELPLTHDTSAEKHSQLDVRELIAFNKGFAFVSGIDSVILFERETSNKYTKRNLFKISGIEFRDNAIVDINYIHTLCINLAEDTLMITTERCQMYSVQLWGPDMLHSPVIEFAVLGESLHYGPIKDLALCVWKSLFVTAGEIDKTIRVWNYTDHRLEMMKEFQERIHSIALHPTGLYLLIGFTDMLRFTMLLNDDVKSVREFPIRNCSLCNFSTSGHLFAAVNGNIIHIYSSVTFESLHNMKGHKGIVTSMQWFNGDTQLATVGSEGAIYEWDIAAAKRTCEVISCSEFRYLNCAVVGFNDGHMCYSIDTDGQISEIQDSALVRSFKLSEWPLEHIVYSHTGDVMFVGTAMGAILVVKLPLTYPPTFKEYSLHNKAITKLCLDYDDQSIITTSKDGTICIWKMFFSEGKSLQIHKHFAFSKEVLVNKRDLEEKISSINILMARIVELETEHAYQIRQLEADSNEKARETNDGFCVALEELKSKTERLENDHSQEMANINGNIAKMKAEHGKVVEDMETNFNAKFIFEYEKYHALEAKLQKTKQDLEEQLACVVAEKNLEFDKMEETLTIKLQEKNLQCEEITEVSLHKLAEHEEMKNQIENDVDEEILELRAHYENLLREERDISARLNGEITVSKKKYISSQRETNEYNRLMHEMQKELQKTQATIVSLERDCFELKNEIRERDGTLTDKENRIRELKQRNQELEKFKTVLDHKINELISRIEPKDREIMENRIQIKDMEEEMKNLQKLNTNMNLQVQELRRKLSISEKEFEMEHVKNKQAEVLLQKIRSDLHDASGSIQDPKKLRLAVKKMYHSYHDDRLHVAKTVEVEDAQHEFMRQRHHLETSVATLKHQVQKKQEISDHKVKMLDENINLLEEVNKLRTELKLSQRRVRELEAILGMGGTTYMKPWVAQARLRMAVKTKQDIEDEFLKKICVSERNVVMLKEEITRLIAKLPKKEQQAHARNEQNIKKMIKINELRNELESSNKTFVKPAPRDKSV